MLQRYLFIFYLNFCFFILKLKELIFGKTEHKRVVTVLDETNKYVLKKRNWFQDKIKLVERKQLTQNISPIFYSKKQYDNVMKDIDNLTEKEWKTRIIYEVTPKGNIVMFYDAFKLGFVYFSDINWVDYHTLNSVAMKYVITYRCLDFFMDDEFIERSPLYDIHFQEDKPVIPQKKTDEMKFLKDAPFVKPTKSNPTTQSFLPPPKIILRNKFIYMGKTVNFQFLQNTVILKPGFKTSYNEVFTQETSYSEYKKKKLNLKN